ncbi:MAG: hypothetical protein WBP18_07140 [Paracoccaceae bacterium]|jgi:hypothetical protein
MTDVGIGQMTTTIEFEPEVKTASPQGMARAAAEATDVQRLKELLRPVIMDILGDELDLHERMRG